MSNTQNWRMVPCAKNEMMPRMVCRRQDISLNQSNKAMRKTVLEGAGLGDFKTWWTAQAYQILCHEPVNCCRLGWSFRGGDGSQRLLRISWRVVTARVRPLCTKSLTTRLMVPTSILGGVIPILRCNQEKTPNLCNADHDGYTQCLRYCKMLLGRAN